MQVLTPIMALLVNVLAQITISRYIHKLGLLKSIFIGFGAGFIFMFVFDAAWYIREMDNNELIYIFITNVFIYGALGYCYFHFVNLGETARRIRILREIHDAQNGLTIEEILQKYNALEIIERRLNRLLSNGQVVFKDGKYFIGKPFILYTAKLIHLTKIAIIGKKSEFE